MESRNEDKLEESPRIIADPRLERLLVIAQQMNDLKVRIRAATEYIIGKERKADLADVEFARAELGRELQRNQDEAATLMPVIEDMVGKYQEQIRSLNDAKKLNMGLARIEKLSGSADRSREYEETAASETEQISSIENLVSALDSLERDLSTRKPDSITCPRCSSPSVAYRIQPSDTGFTLYRCNQCSNAWKVTRFSMTFG